jgi:hypothetical protein
VVSAFMVLGAVASMLVSGRMASVRQRSLKAWVWATAVIGPISPLALYALGGRRETTASSDKPSGWTIQVMQVGADGEVSFRNFNAAIPDPTEVIAATEGLLSHRHRATVHHIAPLSPVELATLRCGEVREHSASVLHRSARTETPGSRDADVLAPRAPMRSRQLVAPQLATDQGKNATSCTRLHIRNRARPACRPPGCRGR